MREKGKRKNQKLRNSPKKKLVANVRSYLSQVMSGRQTAKKSKTFEILGYTPLELAAHLEAHFSEGMSWKNHGEWHIDHIQPLASFSWSCVDDEDFKKAWALENLQPLWAEDNLLKGAKEEKCA